MTDRRQFLKNIAGLALVGSSGLLMPRTGLAAVPGDAPGLPAGTLDESVLASLPGKRPLIKRVYRAPCYETPTSYFNEVFTPNDAFFVRYHLANIPEVDAREWRLRIGGDAAGKPVEFTLDELRNPKNFETVELAAVCQCAGNRRGLHVPHVAGVEWAYGAMGNARWKGVRLKDVLAKAGIKKEALEVTLNGTDRGVLDKTPDFVKSLPMWKALDENTLIAFEMNGQPLPHWNGYPARLIVPGWTATYWMKHIAEINIVSKAFDGFWMAKAYRIPQGKFPLTARFVSQENDTNTPITEMVVNSLITNIRNGQHFAHGQNIEVRGIAWDAGYGLQMVEVSTDDGRNWQRAELGRDYGNYSWRQWSLRFKPAKKGPVAIMAKASSRNGSTQTFELIHNPAGYHHNVVQPLNVIVG
jgi:DMSO/TMAO reductase YedYZ molybdopterin-dependent catalytic subunit